MPVIYSLAEFLIFSSDHPDEVQAIVERANKDIAIESLLNTFEEVWLSRQLELRPHRSLAQTARQEVSLA